MILRAKGDRNRRILEELAYRGPRRPRTHNDLVLSPRSPLKGSFKGDMDIDVDIGIDIDKGQGGFQKPWSEESFC